MSNVIHFLESVGSAARLQSAADYAAAVAASDLEPSERKALLDRDVRSLTKIMRGRASMFCMIIAPDEQQGEHELPDQADEQTDGDGEPGESQ